MTLRIKRGAKLLSEVKVGRARLVIGSGQTAQLRLKNAGLPEESLVLDTRAEPFGIESKLDTGEVKVNGRVVRSTSVKIGDVIELCGLAIEIAEADAAPRKSEPPAPSPLGAEPTHDDEDGLDPYMGKATAAAVKQADVERARRALEKLKAAESAPNRERTGSSSERTAVPARPVVPQEPAGASRPPWLELVGDDSVADARLRIDGTLVVGRQGDVRVRHPSVSKQHARFTVEPGKLFVEDLGSTNGVWINRMRVQGRNEIHDGDTLHLGSVEFVVRIPAASKSEPTTLGAAPQEAAAPTTRIEGLPGAKERRTEVSGEAPALRHARTDGIGIPVGPTTTRSPFQEAELELGDSTGTGHPGRRDPTENEIPIAKRPEPRMPAKTFAVEDLSERLAREPWARPGTAQPARTPLRVEDSVPELVVPRRAGRGRMLVVAVVLAAAGAVLALRGLRSQSAGGDSDLAVVPDAAAPGKDAGEKSKKSGSTTARREPGKKSSGTVPAAGSSPGGTPSPEVVAAPEPAGDGRISIFTEAPVDLRGDGRLDAAVASLEKNSAEKGLRAERTIGEGELKSIFLSDANAVVRKLYRDDGFNRAPSAADDDPRDAEARRQGAKQIDTGSVNRLIRDKFPSVKRCLVGASVKRGTARVVVEFTIQPSGRVGEASVVDSDIGGSSFESCVTSVIRGIKFPKPKEQSVVVQFPFVFTYN